MGTFLLVFEQKCRSKLKKLGFIISLKIVFGNFRVQGPKKKKLHGLGIFPGVPYHICKTRVKVSYVSDHWGESRIFWPEALF